MENLFCAKNLLPLLVDNYKNWLILPEGKKFSLWKLYGPGFYRLSKKSLKSRIPDNLDQSRLYMLISDLKLLLIMMADYITLSLVVVNSLILAFILFSCPSSCLENLQK